MQGQSKSEKKKSGPSQEVSAVSSVLKRQDQKDLNCLWVSRISADSIIFLVCENLKVDNMFQLNTLEMKSYLITTMRRYFKMVHLRNMNAKHYGWIFHHQSQKSGRFWIFISCLKTQECPKKYCSTWKSYSTWATMDQISPVAPASEIPFSILPRGSVFKTLSFGLQICLGMKDSI